MPHTDQHLGIRKRDRSLRAYRLYRQWWPSGFLSLLPVLVPAAKAVHANLPSWEDWFWHYDVGAVVSDPAHYGFE